MSRHYRELPPPPDLAAWVRCRWIATGDGGGEVSWVVPDGCLDLMWLDGDLIVAGPDDAPNPYRPRPGTVMGIRFRPGRAAPVLREDPGRMRNQRVAYVDLGAAWVDALAERAADAAGAGDTRAVLGLLADEVRARTGAAGEPDALGAAAADRLEASGGNAPIGILARELAVSERHLRRQATAALGYGPKTFARIVRFQRALALLEEGRPPADVAAEAGYADQPHLTREVTTLAGRTPGEVLHGRSVQDEAGASP